MYQQRNQDLTRPSALWPSLRVDQDKFMNNKDISETYCNFEKASNNYLTSVDRQGSAISHYSQQLSTAKSRLDLPTQEMAHSLQKARQDFSHTDELVSRLQFDIQHNIAKCQGRQIEHQNTIDNNRYSIEYKSDKVSELETEIRSVDTDIRQYESDASHFDCCANTEKESESNHDTINVVGGILIAGVGLILAPFSAGWSIPAAGVGIAANSGINVAEARKHAQKAEEFRSKASQERNRATDLENKKDGLNSEISCLKQEIGDLQDEIVELEDAKRRLTKVSDQLHSATRFTYCVIDSIKDIVCVMNEAETVGKQFIIVQNALRRHPKKLDHLSQKMVEQFRSLWSKLEDLVVNSPTHIYQRLRALEQSNSSFSWQTPHQYQQFRGYQTAPNYFQPFNGYQPASIFN